MFFEIKSDRKLILSGLGIQKEEYIDFINNYYMDYTIAGLADCELKKENAYVRGYTIVDTEDWEKLDGMLVLFGDDWYERAEELRKDGYVLLRDYVPEWYFEFGYKSTCLSWNKISSSVKEQDLYKYVLYISYAKPIAIVVGGNQVPDLVRVLSRTKELCDRYVWVSVLPINNMRNNNTMLPEYLADKIRLLIIQNSNDMTSDIKKDLLKNVKSNCEVITIPEYTLLGLFDADFDEGSFKDVKEYGDRFIEKMQTNLIEQEEGSDVFFAEWIIENFNKVRFFDDSKHPSLELYKKYCRELSRYLNIVSRPNINTEGVRLSTEKELSVDNRLIRILNLEWGHKKGQVSDE